LQSSKPQDGWLGNIDGWPEKTHSASIAPAGDYKGDASAACWLPSARVAATWQAFNAYDPGAKLTEPAGLGDMRPFTLHESQKAVRVVVEAKPGFTKVELRDGEKVLAMRDAAPFEFEVKLSPGSHPLIAAVYRGNEQPRFSRPQTVVVKR
jgi:hypothetical protein